MTNVVFSVFVIGIVLGCVATQVIMRYKAGYGTFRLDPIENEDSDDLGIYTVTINIKQNQKLINKKKIILRRETGNGNQITPH